MKTSVIIVAAGVGKRMGSSIPKQFLELNGKPILHYTIDTFEKSVVNEIIIVTNKENIDYVKNEIALPFKKVKAVVAGGSERQYSVYNGIKTVDKNCDIVLIHDGVRPFVTQDNINDIIAETAENSCCVLGMPIKDTIKMCDENGFVSSTPQRSLVWQAQTPQAFKYDLILNAYEKAMSDDFLGTDDSMLVERLGYKIKMVKGSYQNIKITTPDDINIGNSILNGNS